MCRYTHLASYTFGQILGQCLHVIPEESGLSSKPVSGNKGANLGLERDQSQGTSTGCHMTSVRFSFPAWAFSLPLLQEGGGTSPISSYKLLSSFQMISTDWAFFERMVQLIPSLSTSVPFVGNDVLSHQRQKWEESLDLVSESLSGFGNLVSVSRH